MRRHKVNVPLKTFDTTLFSKTFLKNKDHPVPQPAAFQQQVKKNQTQVRPNMPHRRSRSNFEVKASGKSATQELSPYVLSERSLANLKTSTVSISITTTQDGGVDVARGPQSE